MAQHANDKRVTLQQVADDAGVSKSAASFALTGRTDQRISQVTIARVKAAANKLGYHPNLAAKTLRTGTSDTVALVSDFVATTSVANEMVAGVLNELRVHSKFLYTVDTEGRPKAEKHLIQTLLDRQVDGVLYASMFTREIPVSAISDLSNITGQMPLVLLNCLSSHPTKISAVVPDEYNAGRMAADVLIKAGHGQRIGFMGQFPPEVTGGVQWHGWHPWALEQRLLGIRDRLAESNFKLMKIYESDEWDVRSGRAVARKLLASKEDLPSAIICVNDSMAFGLMQILQLNGFSVPRDISLISFDGSEWAKACIPSLTTICLPQREMGRSAVRLMLSQKSGVTKHVPMPLSVGGTVARPSSR
ncbi:hypothetical protein BA20089_08645 [Bifidobacterium asteroides DSM 20089]|uniref:HTH lacI-type domain-containing protein n=1 Tax=Bifidobacterium asteroides DSM 20089 TaxID=1437594 RepID=A0AAD0A8U0_9BIFI|nr:LacI family DNA-binding transcriptional regulator [Bifidobacterium asteroides]AFU70763.1 transcriptional regulator, LacI family [Bifidobacterium asteroides PRL2011]ATO40754.1 hypothetical protein BA20089_00045 [Bifidobacterium asteroides DSM 20089]ATO42160.1 hypothetical protein BA20089_08645 [Bifidobacterium asteroides DSM 20089]